MNRDTSQPGQPSQPGAPTSRQPQGTPVGGQFAASERAEADVTLGQARPHMAEMTQEQAAQFALGQRLAAYDRLKDFGAEGQVRTIAWPEEPNDDGTFDVDLGEVADHTGAHVEDLGGHGAEAAGWYDDRATAGWRTAYDAWRQDSQDPTSPIVMAKVQQWHADHHRHVNAKMLDDLTTIDEQGRRWVETEDDWSAAERARLEVQTPTPYEDLRPGDRFVIDEVDRLVECRVLGEAGDTVDRFQRPMRAFLVRRDDNGMEGLHMFGPGGIARKVEQPVHLRVDPADQPTEQQLNEAWGV